MCFLFVSFFLFLAMKRYQTGVGVQWDSKNITFLSFNIGSNNLIILKFISYELSSKCCLIHLMGYHIFGVLI